PELMPFDFKEEYAHKVVKWAAENRSVGTVVLVSSDNMATNWSDVAIVAKGSQEVEKLVLQLQENQFRGPVVFANRYDGIDLPGDSCRLLVMN
ncbi:helicase, partial [Halomonas sp. SIMBA_159]